MIKALDINFDATPIREYDGDGRLIASGADWNERNGHARGLIGFGTAVAALPTVVAVIAALGPARYSADWTAFLAFMLAVLFLLWRGWKRFGAAKRSLVFRADGESLIPRGTPWHPRARRLSRPHSSILSIESKAYPDEHVVRLSYGTGDLLYIARGLVEWEAHKVAVQLSNALAALRESQATAQRTRQASAERRSRPNRLID